MLTDEELVRMWLAAEMDDIYSFPEYKRIMMRQMEADDDDTAKFQQTDGAVHGVPDTDG